MHLSDAGFFPRHPPSKLPTNYEQQFCLLKLNMDSSSLDEVLHIPNTLMARESCPQTSSFPDLLVYRCLAYSDDCSENPFSESFWLHFDKELDGIPSSTGSLILFLILLGFGKLYSLFILVIAHSCFPEYLTQGFGVVKLNSILVGLW
jgi:hypothetical protein